MTRVPVRDDLSALEGYHSPQVDVRVRLNTNEAPVAPPAAFRQAYAEAVAKIEWHRYPDRGATALRVASPFSYAVVMDIPVKVIEAGRIMVSKQPTGNTQ